MSRLTEPLLVPNRSLQLQVLSGPLCVLEGRVLDTTSRQMLFAAQSALPLGAVVCIELPDRLVLGEVCHHEKQGEEHRLWILFHEVLAGLDELHPEWRR